MQEIRILFRSYDDDGYRILLTDAKGNRLGVESNFTPFLEERDYKELRWYLEQYLDLPDGGAVILAGGA